jgi:carbon storage regulator
MLVIRRREGESLLIGDQIEVEILEINGSQVKLGVHAPREIPILRKEVCLTMQANQDAARMTGDAIARIFEALSRHSTGTDSNYSGG